MAIINCPECKEKISNTSNRCIHCGAKITFCPECEQVFAVECEICPECGYKIKESTETEKEENETSHYKSAVSVTDKWKSGNMFHNLNSYGELIFNIISFLLVVVACFKFTDWTSGLSDLDNLLSADTVLKDLKHIFVFILIFSTCSVIVDQLNPYIDAALFSTWAKERKINLSNLINISFSNNFDGKVVEQIEKEATELKLIVNAEYIKNDIFNRSKRIAIYIITTVIYVISGLFFMWFGLDNIEIFMRAELSKSEILNIPGWSFSMIEWKNLIFTGLFAIAYHILRYLGKKYVERLRSDWIKKNYSEHSYKYEKYVVDPESFAIAEEVNSSDL